MFSVAPAGKATSRTLRNRLALTTMLAAMPFLGYGRQAYAACDTAPPSTVFCDGTISGDTIWVTNADVTTRATPPFVVETDGLRIYGNGHLKFTDNNSSSITNEHGAALTVISTGDDPETETLGAVTITTNGTFTGDRDGIYARNEGSGDITITADGTVSGLGLDGIYAFNDTGSGALTITTGAQSSIYGAQNGIDARNYGRYNLTITTGGEVTSNFDGIYARNYGQDLAVTIKATSTVNAGGDGIRADNQGSGDLNIIVDGSVISRNYDGIHAENEGANLIITTGAGSVVRGNGVVDLESDVQDSNGIDALNRGSGYLKITADGTVFGNLNDAIYARNFGSDLIIETGAQSDIKGGGNGIGAYNYGIGKLTITADGLVGGYAVDGDGIHAVNYNPEVQIFDPEFTRDLTITTGAGSRIRGVADGIDARNYGFGDLTITTNGEVTGKTGDGIFARNVDNYLYLGGDEGVFGDALGLTITTGPQSVVTGKRNGIYAEDTGYGDFLITANGRVTGETEDGIYGFDGSEGYGEGYIQGNFTIVTGAGSIVTGGRNGIAARNEGSGNLTIEANGQVLGLGGDGIYAINDPYYEEGKALTISTGLGSVVTGMGNDGIRARQSGSGAFKITVEGTVTGRGEAECDCKEFGFGIDVFNENGESTEIEIGAAGLVQGRVAGIYALSDSSQFITITNDGVVRNLSELASRAAIITNGGGSRIDNTGAIVGTLWLSNEFSDTLNNDGVWVTTGENDFGAENEDVVNNRGTLFGAQDKTLQEAPVIYGLEEFNNEGGLISLIDGQAGDELRIESQQYTSAGGHLAVDAVLGGPSPDKLADDLWILGGASGTTTIHVNVLDAKGGNEEGILVARVQGAADENTFVLDGPINAGFYTWGLQYEALGDDHLYELVTTGIGVGAEEFAAGITATQDIWFQTAGTVLQRQADLRALLEGTGVTPVADFAEPVAPTPVARITPGFWFSGLGAYLKRDDEQDGFTLDRKQTIWGGMAGFDFGTQTVSDAWLFGVFGGYMTSDLKFNETNTEWNYDGPTIGAYATYLNHALFVDATIKADFLNISIDPDDLAPDADDSDTDAVNVGGRIDTGYKFGEEFFFEPQASLAIVYTDIDDVDAFGGTVEFDNETSVRGRLGARVGVDHEASDATVYTGDVIASVWETFTGDNNATIADPALPNFGVSDNPGETMGDLSLGFSVASPEGWSGFLRGNYQFADGYDAYSGNAGVRYAW